MFHNVSSGYSQLTKAITGDDSWSWAKGGTQEQKLNAAHGAMTEGMSAFHREYVLATDMNALKRRCSVETLIIECKSFILLKDKIEKVGSITSAMLRAHDEIMKG